LLREGHTQHGLKREVVKVPPISNDSPEGKKSPSDGEGAEELSREGDQDGGLQREKEIYNQMKGNKITGENLAERGGGKKGVDLGLSGKEALWVRAGKEEQAS